MMLADQIATGVNWMLVATIVMAAGTVGMWLDARKQRKVSLEQPVDVRLVKALHEEFANKEDVDEHIKSNTERHAQLFKAIERVERETRETMDNRFILLAQDRQQTMEKLNTQFTFIRENIAAINRELQIRNRNK